MSASRELIRRVKFVAGRGAILLASVAQASMVSAATPSDFDGDGKGDILWRHAATGENLLWIMNGATVTASGPLSTLPARAWRIQGTHDLSGDGKADIFWRHQDTGENRVWKMDGRRVLGQVTLPALPDTDWQVGAVCDLDGDRTADILLRHAATGENVLWRMSDGTPSAVLPVTAVLDPAWRVAACADFSGDGKADLLWRHAVSGQNSVWLMNGAAPLSSAALTPRADQAWRVAGAGDFDGDGKADILWRHAATGANELTRMDGLVAAGGGPLPPLSASDWQVAGVSDFDGDRKTDVLWRETTSGANVIWFMDGTTERAVTATTLPDPSWTSPLSAPAAGPQLFLATLTPEVGAATTATGTSTVRLAADEKSALVSLDFAGLGSPQTAAHIHGPASPGQNAAAVFSLPEGAFRDLLWLFAPTGGLTVIDQVTALKTGRLYVNVHSSTYPNGEIRGQLRIVPGSAPLPPPPPPPPPTGPPTAAAAFRFLEQSTMGPTPALVSHVQSVGYDAFLAEQFAEPQTSYLDFVQTVATVNDTSKVNALRNRFFIAALHGNDQLRQRVALALSQIVVVSTRGLYDGPALAVYMDVLMRNAFGNYRTLLEEITLNPAMGNYLDMVNNDKPNPSRGRTANENYAREVMQLFSIGLYKLNPNGTLQLDAGGRPVPTYDQAVIEGMARVFTGWTYAPLPGATPRRRNPRNYLAPMVLWPQSHDTGAKRIVDGRVLPARQTGEVDLQAALGALFSHPNVGPFAGRQLIQHLVTSNPSPGYVARVAGAFADDGAGVRGDMKAVIRAVLLDPEARREPTLDFGRPREPLTFVTGLLRKLEATGDGFGLIYLAGNMGQSPLGPPTVFGFYVPDYQVPGSTLFGPPLEIHTESTAIRRSNFVYSLVFGSISVPSHAPPGATSVAIDLTPWVDLAGNPAALVDQLNLRLMGGSMPADMRNAVAQAVAKTSASNTSTRAKTAIYLVATSPQYNVQR